MPGHTIIRLLSSVISSWMRADLACITGFRKGCSSLINVSSWISNVASVKIPDSHLGISNGSQQKFHISPDVRQFIKLDSMDQLRLVLVASLLPIVTSQTELLDSTSGLPIEFLRLMVLADFSLTPVGLRLCKSS